MDKDGQSVSFDFQGIIILESEGYWPRVTMAQSRVKKSTTGSPARGIETWQTPQSTRRWSIAGPGHQTAFEKLSLLSQCVHHGHLVISVLIKPGLDLNWNFSRLPWIAPQGSFSAPSETAFCWRFDSPRDACNKNPGKVRRGFTDIKRLFGSEVN